MRMTVLNASDTAAVYAAQSRADKLDLAVLELANEGYRILKGGAISAQGSPNLTVALAAGCDLNNGREVWYAAQNSAAVTAPSAGNDKFILVEVDALGVVKVDNTTTGPVTGDTARPVPTAGRVVHGLIYISASTITDIDGTTTAGHGKIQDLGVLSPAQPPGSEFMQRWGVILEDFLSASVADGSIGQYGWSMTASGAGAAFTTGAISSTGWFGWGQLSTGTTTTGFNFLNLRAGLLWGVANDMTAEWSIFLNNLSTSTQEFEVLVGLHNNLSDGTTEPQDGLYFKYDRVNTGANWQCVSANNSTRTTIDSGIAALADGNFHRLKIVVDNANAKAHFYIDDVECASSPITTNLPGTARNFTPAVNIGKKAGTTARTVAFDYFYLQRSLNRT